MGLHSLRILAQAGFSGVFFAAKILRGELPRYRLPLPEFAANVIPCSAPLTLQSLAASGTRHSPYTGLQRPPLPDYTLPNRTVNKEFGLEMAEK